MLHLGVPRLGGSVGRRHRPHMHGDGDAFRRRGLVDVCEAQAVDTGMLGV